MVTSKRTNRVTVFDIFNRCTGMMKLDSDGNYAGYYKYGELYHELLKQGHSRANVEMFMPGIGECKEVHPEV